MLVSMEASAQLKIGIKGGWNFDNLDISNSFEKLKKENVTSWDLGVVAQIPLTGALYLQPEVLYLSEKLDLNTQTSIIPVGVSGSDIEFASIRVPVNLLYKFDLTVLSVFASGGIYFGYAFDRNNSANWLRKTDWGATFGIGAEFLRFQVSARYNWAIQNISDVGAIKWKNNQFNLSVAFFIL